MGEDGPRSEQAEAIGAVVGAPLIEEPSKAAFLLIVLWGDARGRSDRIVYGPRLSGIRARPRLNELVERSLQAAFLWDEVKDRLHTSAMRLSGGQQQRLCLARVLAMEPEVILLDEPCSGLDPISTARIEEALSALKNTYTIVLVTNNTKQAARVADITAFLLQGELVECGPTSRIFTAPKDQRTNDYVSGRFG